MLQRLAPAEVAAVLNVLLGRYPNLREEAERIAVELLSFPSADEVSEGLYTALTSLGIDALNRRSGRQRGRYVEPSEAAWELLDEAVEDAMGDMKRRMELGLEESAEVICQGIVAGLRRAEEFPSDGVLAWAPDFPAEKACHAVGEFLRACPKEKRRAVRDRLIGAVGEGAPDWSDLLDRAAKRSVQGK
ncbi:MAG: hypothetical protein HY900_36565 [Deltaproteobacteria bacterium]|nr:hypothetical protein [Deltaproteobacteria bacterium]